MLSPVAGELEQVAAAGWPWAARAIGSHALVTSDDSINPVDASMLGRAPQRITITLPHHVYKQIAQRSIVEGRSISNLAAYLLERAVFG